MSLQALVLSFSLLILVFQWFHPYMISKVTPGFFNSIRQKIHITIGLVLSMMFIILFILLFSFKTSVCINSILEVVMSIVILSSIINNAIYSWNVQKLLKTLNRNDFIFDLFLTYVVSFIILMILTASLRSIYFGNPFASISFTPSSDIIDVSLVNVILFTITSLSAHTYFAFAIVDIMYPSKKDKDKSIDITIRRKKNQKVKSFTRFRNRFIAVLVGLFMCLLFFADQSFDDTLYTQSYIQRFENIIDVYHLIMSAMIIPLVLNVLIDGKKEVIETSNNEEISNQGENDDQPKTH